MFFIPLIIVDYFSTVNSESAPIPVATPSKAWVFGGSLARIAGSNPVGDIDVCLS